MVNLIVCKLYIYIFGLYIFTISLFYLDAFCLSAIELPHTIDTPKSWSLKNIIDNGILWAVPKHRRTIERRWKRKYGSPEYFLKILLPKTNLRVCDNCGGHHEVGLLCGKL